MKKKRRNSSGTVAYLLLAALLLALPATLRAQENKELENKEQENKEQNKEQKNKQKDEQKKEGNKEQQDKLRKNINAYDHLIPHRGGADKFENKKFSEHLFYSVTGGVTQLFDSGNGNKAFGPKGSAQVGNWFTPVIGARVGLDYGQWKSDARTLQTMGMSLDYLMNITAFASRYRKGRRFEVIGLFGLSYQATLQGGGEKLIHTYGLHAGLQAKLNLSSHFSLFIEPQIGIYPDRVDGLSTWKRYDLAGTAMLGITFRPAGMFGAGRRSLEGLNVDDIPFLQGCFSGISVGTGGAGGLLFNSEVALGKWFGDVNGLRISAGSSTAFLSKKESDTMLDNPAEEKEFNVSLSVDYLCNLSNLLLAERTDRLFSVLFVAGVGSYFPGSDSGEKIVVNGRFGFQGNIRVTKHCGVWLEPRINLYKDNSERIDGQKPLRGSAGLMIGTTYNF